MRARVAMSNGAPRPSTGISKERARSGLSRLQAFTGVLLLASMLSGTYLLYTEGTLSALSIPCTHVVCECEYI